jgi:hypothetical protein
MGMQGEKRYSSYSFLTSALDGGWVVSVTPRPCFSPGERTPSTHCTGGWVGTRAGLDTEARGKVLCLCWVSSPVRPVVQPVARHHTDWATPAPPHTNTVGKFQLKMSTESLPMSYKLEKILLLFTESAQFSCNIKCQSLLRGIYNLVFIEGKVSFLN